MTYLDKLMSAAIKFDDELLTAVEINLLRQSIRAGICVCVRPARFSFLGCDKKTEWDDEYKAAEAIR